VEVVEPEGAVTHIRVRPPDVLLVCLPMEPVLLRALCAADAGHAAYIIALIPDDHIARSVPSAIAAGCHDVLKAPFTDEELWTRVEVLERLRGWNRFANPNTSAKHTYEEARGWRFLGDVVADDIESMLCQRVRVTPHGACSDHAVRMASIPMVLSADHLELFIAVRATREGCAQLGENLLGDPDPAPEMIDDVLREMANAAGGAVKRALLPEGIVLTTGLPIGGDADPVPSTTTARAWDLDAEGGATLTIVADVRPRRNFVVPTRTLCEGMVIVDDLRNAAGVLLLPGGTRLTATTAERLRRILSVAHVEISSAA